MRELKCPHCGNVFSVDENDYAALLNQVRNSEFEAELSRRMHEMDETRRARQQAEQTRRDAEQQAAQAQMQLQLQTLQAQIQQAEQQKQLAVAQVRQKATEEYLKKDRELAEAKAKWETELKAAQEQIAYYKELKTRLSTKMVGETLEIHCSTLFNQLLRPLMPYAYFEKDNEVVEGTKGDFVFRDRSEDGVEYISIMFEMKNENDETATKHKNEDFLAKLDSDRRKKGCEYAVLVSMLEPESELYNGGIVDMSHRFEKMYVIRPQFFIPLITVLRNAALRSLAMRTELAQMQRQNIDVTRFEERMEEFKTRFGKNYQLASNRFNTAIEEIDKTISHLQKVKENLLSSEHQLRLANDKAQGLTIRKLTYRNPTMKAKFEDARRAAQDEEEG